MSISAIRNLVKIILFCFFFISCYKTDPTILQLLNDIKAQNEALKNQITNLQKTTDSLSNSLKATNVSIGNIDKKVDSLKIQINSVLQQINQLNIQMASANANIIDIQLKIVDLQKKCQQLYDLLNNYILSINNASLQTGLVAYYPFTGNANDSSGNNNNASVLGAILTAGKKGFTNTAYNFNGSTSSIDIPNAFFSGKQVNNFSISTRVRFNSTLNSPNIWGKTFFWGELNLLVNPDNSITLFWANSYSGNKYSNATTVANVIKLNNWHDIVTVYENSTIKLYVDGINVQVSLSWSAQGGSLISTSQVESFCNFAQDPNTSKFGARFVSGQKTAFLNGDLDDFRLYNRSLTESEIKSLTAL
jgi:Concanavalin A-like lectin/glucanases superfamily